jgi:hypothetical protein
LPSVKTDSKIIKRSLKKHDNDSKLRLPLLKGYDDYDREMFELFGDERDRILNMIDAEASKNFRKIKMVTPQDIESAKSDIRL